MPMLLYNMSARLLDKHSRPLVIELVKGCFVELTHTYLNTTL